MRAKPILATAQAPMKPMNEEQTLKGRLKTFWNNYDPYWESIESAASSLSPQRQRAYDFVPQLGGARVLDLGCGNAANGKWLKEKCRYVGLDVSHRALELAVCHPASLVCGDTDELPFRDEAFDAVIATYVTEHLVDPRRGLAEVCRVVRRGGTIILLGPSWDFPFWYPNSLKVRGRKRWWRLFYTAHRLAGQLEGWFLKRFPFYIVKNPEVFQFGYTYDEDAVYVVWSYEVIEYFRRFGSRLLHWEVDDQLLGHNPFVRFLKSLLLALPPFRYAGSTVLLVFEKR